ncbi:MAG: ZinT/AdcA family metal-binding protein, partial [Spirochaetaceae bacterium]|nr:ZinT/AdcA family metal-binding protein [Spirochaetaceae bacterium]
MKRIVLYICIMVSLTMGVSAGGRRDAAKKTDGKIQVVTTIFPPYDFVRQIAGNKVNLTMLLPPGAESHSFEPTPQDIIKVQNCDVFIYVGGESDAWVEMILESMDTSRMEIITLMDCVEVVEEIVVEGMQDDEEGHDHDHSHEPEAFTLEDIKDRSLTDWAGDWQSVYPHLLDGTLDPVMEHKAESGEKTVREYYDQYKTAYMTDVDRVVITGESMTFYRNGVPARAQYAYRGTGVI